MSAGSDQTLDALQAAYRAFERRRFGTVVARLDESSPDGDGLGPGLLLAASALLLEERGLPDEAEPLMARVVALGVPLPEVQREAAAFFTRRGDHERAHHAFLMAETLAPRHPPEALHGIPAEAMVRYGPWLLRAARSPQGNGYLAGTAKSFMDEALGPEAAALIVAGIREPGQEWPRNGVTRRPVISLMDHAKAHGIEYEEVIPSREVSVIPPRVLGQEPGEPHPVTSRALFTCLLEDVVAVGKSNLLLAGDEILMDSQAGELEHFELNLRVDALVGAGSGTDILVVEPRNPDRVRRVPEAIWLVGVHSNVFGHWITEFLPKLLALMERPGFADVPLLIDRDMHRQHLEVLRACLGRQPRTIALRPGEHVRVGRLWVGSQLSYRPISATLDSNVPDTSVIDGEGLARLFGRLGERLDAIEPLPGHECIYIPRRSWQKRKLVNAEELEPILEAAGFVRFDPWDASFERQLRVIRGVRYLVAPEGSALTLALFAPPGLRVGVLSHRFLFGFELYATAFEALGHRFTVVAGEATQEEPGLMRMHSDFRIEPADLRTLLEDIGANEEG